MPSVDLKSAYQNITHLFDETIGFSVALYLKTSLFVLTLYQKYGILILVINLKFVFNTFPIDEGLDIREIGFNHTYPNRKYGPLARTDYILHYIVSGTCRYNGTFLGPGEGFMITPKELEFLEVYDEPLEHYWIVFQGTRVEELLEKCGIPNTSHKFSVKQNAQRIRMIFERAIKTDLSGMNLSFYYTSVFYELLSLHNENKHTKGNIVDHAKRYISSNISQKITVEDIAKRCAISPKYLCKVFKNTVGVSPLSYVLTEKFEAAKDLLLSTDMPIKEIAAAVGFDDSCYFSTAFRSHEKVSPGQFRAAHRR